MKDNTSKQVSPLSLLTILVVTGTVAAILALAGKPVLLEAQDTDPKSTANLIMSVVEAEAGQAIDVRGTGFRVETDGSFIYTSTITVGGVAIAGVESVDLASGYLHAARTTATGWHIAEHIDIDPGTYDAGRRLHCPGSAARQFAGWRTPTGDDVLLGRAGGRLPRGRRWPMRNGGPGRRGE